MGGSSKWKLSPEEKLTGILAVASNIRETVRWGGSGGLYSVCLGADYKLPNYPAGASTHCGHPSRDLNYSGECDCVFVFDQKVWKSWRVLKSVYQDSLRQTSNRDGRFVLLWPVRT